MEAVEFLGSGYTSLAAYFCAQLAELIDPSVHWILATIDMSAVQRRFETDQYRYIFEHGTIYRAGASHCRRPGESR